jgi:hypothetical protein
MCLLAISRVVVALGLPQIVNVSSAGSIVPLEEIVVIAVVMIHVFLPGPMSVRLLVAK